jgi:hypothetical protein
MPRATRDWACKGSVTARSNATAASRSPEIVVVPVVLIAPHGAILLRATSPGLDAVHQ